MECRYFLHFAHDLVPFRWPEFQALTSKNDCKFTLVSNADHLHDRPYIVIQLDGSHSGEDALIKSASESYLLKNLYELWAHATTIEELVVLAEASSQFSKAKMMHQKTKEPFRMNCESFGGKLTQASKVELMSKMSFVRQFDSPLDLRNPSQIYCIFEMNERQPTSSGAGEIISKEYFFARHLTTSSRSHADKLSLKRRKFIANTSMDPMLSLIAANTARVDRNHIVYDPFVGSGSLLVAAAHLGAYVFGSDIDWQLLHGKSRPSRVGMSKRDDGEGVRMNMCQYDLISNYIDVMVSDISRPSLCDRFKLDAIIADPPYGLREKIERIGKRQMEREAKPNNNYVKYPTKVDYNTAGLISDLLNLAANHLVLGGRLVYFLPVTLERAEDRFEDFLPKHPCLRTIDFCDQQLTSKTHRLLVIMQKTGEPNLITDKVHVPSALVQMDFRATYFNGAREAAAPPRSATNKP